MNPDNIMEKRPQDFNVLKDTFCHLLKCLPLGRSEEVSSSQKLSDFISVFTSV
jgi:hypothetical protein